VLAANFAPGAVPRHDERVRRPVERRIRQPRAAVGDTLPAVVDDAGRGTAVGKGGRRCDASDEDEREEAGHGNLL
jgi:hypothetical protein